MRTYVYISRHMRLYKYLWQKPQHSATKLHIKHIKECSTNFFHDSNVLDFDKKKKATKPSKQQKGKIKIFTQKCKRYYERHCNDTAFVRAILTDFARYGCIFFIFLLFKHENDYGACDWLQRCVLHTYCWVNMFDYFYSSWVKIENMC